MSKKNFILYWTLVIASTSAIFAIVYTVAWAGVRDKPINRPRQYATAGTGYELWRQIEEHLKKHVSLPKDLTDREFSRGYSTRETGFDPIRGPLDGWGRPFHYEVDGREFSLYSYGRDGEPGGIGVDADWTSPTNDWNESPPTLTQFLTTFDDDEMAGSNVLFLALLCGVLTFTTFNIALSAVDRTANTAGTWRTIWGLFNALTITLVATGVVSLGILFFDIQSGH